VATELTTIQVTEAVVRAFKEIMAESCPDDFSVSTDLTSLPIDSMHIVLISSLVEEELGTEIDPATFYEATNIVSIAEEILGELKDEN
jgi:acyl carrier protein